MQDILMVLVGYESNNNRFMAMGQGGVDGLLLWLLISLLEAPACNTPIFWVSNCECCKPCPCFSLAWID